MNDYLITVRNGLAKVARIVDGELEPISFRGIQLVEQAQFWGQFLQKIEYQNNEQLALVLICDDPNFEVDPTIQIAPQFANDASQLAWLIDEQMIAEAQVQLCPEIELMLAEVAVTAKSHSMTTDDVECENHSIQSYFRKQTRAYSNG
ncbi:hypothetical protein [Ferrimonas senticii]|uniref:hypothetical protein n=1 Tax=Ferrimonas senticii TaxID=394566 RepID=UPI0004050006|nr:hypothetical protein [Ferrimonas senticii]